MVHGPDVVVACPKCAVLARYWTLVSGNTFGMRLWTDGKVVYPMLPHPPAVVTCGHCGVCYWLADAEEIGTVDWRYDDRQHIPPEWVAAEQVQEPTEEEYYQALEKHLATGPEQERNLRISAWWRRNDAFRDDPTVAFEGEGDADAQAPWRKNLEALVRLLREEDANESLMMAEALRELGDVESAKHILERVDSAETDDVVRQLHEWCAAADTSVREVRLRS